MTNRLLIFLAVLLSAVVASASDNAENCIAARRLFNQSISAPSPAAEIKLLEEAAGLCRDPEVLGPIYNNLGHAHERLGRLAQAFFYYRQAVRTKPDLAIAYVGGADLYAAVGDAYSAFVLYQKAQRYGYPEDKLQERRDRAARTWPRDLVVYFGKNQANLDLAARERLEGLVEHCKQESGGVSFVIKGFTCELGSRRHNQELARRRALAVTRYLRRQLGSRVRATTITAHGEDNRAVPEPDETARILNRRVRLRVLAGQTATGRLSSSGSTGPDFEMRLCGPFNSR